MAQMPIMTADTPPHAGASTDFLLLRSYGPANALARLQSDPLIDGLQQWQYRAVRIDLSPGKPVAVPRPKIVLVHHDDTEAIHKAHELRKRTRCRVFCLASDIYDLDRYRTIAQVADGFLVPSALHREVLAPAVGIDVQVLHEAVDPIALPSTGLPSAPSRNRDVLWFGYPESFTKSLDPLLARACERAGFETNRIHIITAPGQILLPGAVHHPFDHERFYVDSGHCSYALLSHFALDLHVNTLIKSPNKLITSLVRGLIPLASDTGNYRALMNEYGLGQFLFGNAAELAHLLRNLDPDRDRDAREWQAIATDLRHRFSPRAMAQRFLELVS
jgi:glycosyltransferase involved in cell wall biosynthesis